MNWQILITSLPTENATVRQRIWRALKASGAAVLRDGVYLMPLRKSCSDRLQALAADVREAGGIALVMPVGEPQGAGFAALFDRADDYGPLLAGIVRTRAGVETAPGPDALRVVRRLRRAFEAVAAVDFFAGEARRQTEAALQDLELACARALSPDEPHDLAGRIEPRRVADYRGRIWATRQRPWVDRLASAWLIRRFIDPEARFVWLAHPADRPPDALGFDFDGAEFSHIDSRVTFEVLAASFGLERPPLMRLGQLVHFLDVGGVQPPEASGVENVLRGLRESTGDDDRLLALAGHVFDGLLVAFGERDADG